MARAPLETRDRVAGRIFRQREKDYCAGLRDKSPTWDDATTKARQIGERCDAEKRDGRHHPKAEHKEPDAPVGMLSCHERHERSSAGGSLAEGPIQTKAVTGSYRDGYEAIDWSR